MMLMLFKNHTSAQLIPWGCYEELDQGFDDTYSDSDDDDYSKNSNDSGAQDNVPPSDAQSGYLSQIEKRKKLLEERCMKKLGQVRFEAALEWFGKI